MQVISIHQKHNRFWFWIKTKKEYLKSVNIWQEAYFSQIKLNDVLSLSIENILQNVTSQKRVA